mgnify:CR=1 FL=1
MKRLLWLLPVGLLGAALVLALRPDDPAPAPPTGKPRRIVCLAPVYTEIVFALGAGDRLVGRSKWCNFPPEAERVPIVAEMGQPNLERVVALRPDLVLAPALGKKDAYEKLRGLGLRVEELEPGTFADALAAIRRIGGWIGEERAAEAIVGKIEADRDALVKKLAGCPRVRCAFVVGHEPLYVTGAGTFADDLLALANAENACGDARGWVRYGLEDFLARNPEVILDSTMGYERGVDEQVVAFWKRWQDLAAVKTGRVYAVDPDLTNRPGPRIVGALEQLARRLHPEAFPDGAEGNR